MNKVIEIFRTNEINKLEHIKNEAIIEIKCEDPVYAALRTAKKSIKNADDTVSLRGYTFSDEMNARINAIRVALDNSISELYTKLDEVYMMLNLASTNDDKIKVLKTYGILDKHSNIIR